ncbi:MAG: ABC transporter ATP-binding protein [Pseudomonadota bacterium]
MSDQSIDQAIIAQGLGKEYILGGAEQHHDTFRDLLRGMLTAPFRKFKKLSGNTDENLFWALKDIDFQIPVGQITGVIGRNGAGKSTLLKILSRITTPTTGQVEIRGRVASLLEVGSGFHPELTGRENIYMNASILGMNRKEVHKKLDDIVQFAEVERFLDTPVKRYSSGMYVRLAFSVAAHVDPDVLLVDEVLAVGDAKFQQRCIGKLSEVGQQGRTVLFVSHNMGLIQELCSHALYLEDGVIKDYGLTADVIPSYLNDGVEQKSQWLASDNSGTLRRVRLLDQQGELLYSASYTSTIFAEIGFEALRRDQDYMVTLRITNELGYDILSSWDSDTTVRSTQQGKQYIARCELPTGLLRPGRYFLTARVRNSEHGYLQNVEEKSVEFEITNVNFAKNPQRLGLVMPDLQWEFSQLADGSLNVEDKTG